LIIGHNIALLITQTYMATGAPFHNRLPCRVSRQTLPFPQMSTQFPIRIHLPPKMLQEAQNGAHNFLGKVEGALKKRGHLIEYCPNDVISLAQSADYPGYSLFHMENPFHPRALNMRPSGFSPFWRIETSDARWEWQIAHEAFDPKTVDSKAATAFTDRWRRWRYHAEPEDAYRGNFVYVPLQGKLDAHRSFQTMSPFEMIDCVIKAEPERRIVITTHPNEEYTNDEREKLAALALKHERVLLGCDYVVAQNSSVAFAGYFHHKPALLFAKIDFNHIAVNVEETGVKAGFEAVRGAEPAYDQHIHWFLKDTAINAGSDDAGGRIIAALHAKGWSDI
jgi:hypothetical protein